MKILQRFNFLKKADMFSLEVKLRMKSSKAGGDSQSTVGSFAGFILTVFVFVIILKMGSQKVQDMMLFKNIKYTSLTVRNEFDVEVDSHASGSKLESERKKLEELVISDYDFLPSIKYTVFKAALEDIRSKTISEVFEFPTNPASQPHFNLEKLKKYVKFYTKSRTKGSGVENKILRADMIQCTPEMFSKLPDFEDTATILFTMRLCPDLSAYEDGLKVRGTY